MAKFALITTVGTSLLEEDKELLTQIDIQDLNKELGSSYSIRELKDIKVNIINSWQVLDAIEIGNTNNLDKLEAKFLSVFHCNLNLNDEMKNLRTYHRTKLPAEVTSTYQLIKELERTNSEEINHEYALYLLPSATPDGVFCARILESYFNNTFKQQFGSSINLTVSRERRIKGLNAEKFTDFICTGSKQLLLRIKDLILEAQREDSTVILNVTGGYKGAVPYACFIGMCYDDVSLKYLYERSDGIITLPLLPIDFDLLRRNEYRAIVKVVPTISRELAEGLFTSLGKLQTMFEEDETTHKYRFSPVGEIIEERFEEAEAIKKIARWGAGEVALVLFPEDEEGKRWREDFKQRLPNIQYIWLGDNIPETVDHSRGHCQRLVEMAVQIMKPVLRKVPDFLSPSEAYVLLYTLWIHDIGHSGRKTTYELPNGEEKQVDVSHFPSFVRDLHHELAYEMLEEIPECIGFKKEELCDDMRIVFDAIRTAYRYHRNKMPLESMDFPIKPARFYHWKRVEKSAKELDDDFKLSNHQKIRLSPIIALQRILDACDNQRERVIDNEFRERRIELTKKQIYTEKRRLDKLTRVLYYQIKQNNSFDPLQFQALEQWFFNLWKIYELFEALKAGPKSSTNLKYYIDQIKAHYGQSGLKSSYILKNCIEQIQVQREKLKDIEFEGKSIIGDNKKQSDFELLLSWELISRLDFKASEKLAKGIAVFETTLLKIVQLVWEREKGASDNEKQYFTLLEEWLSCCDQVIFKIIQEDHFTKHNKVNAVFIKPTAIKNSTFTFNLAIELQEDVSLDQEENSWYVIEKMINDVKDEVFKCQKSLETEKGKIIIEGCEIYNYGKLDASKLHIPFNQTG
ncbi:MAG TPA: hypothetical protein VHT73_16030 [Thermodesulfobacteriota bacterium]|nr:hypothetical protein [Thermodesulfobacteriota bacterium]